MLISFEGEERIKGGGIISYGQIYYFSNKFSLLLQIEQQLKKSS